MNSARTEPNWSKFLRLFSEQNKARPARLGVFENQTAASTDYWLADNLPLIGIDIDARGDEPTIEIMLGELIANSPRLTHTVSGARLTRFILSASGEADGLEIADGKGKTTVLRFEN